jgi:hypothetical protein
MRFIRGGIGLYTEGFEVEHKEMSSVSKCMDFKAGLPDGIFSDQKSQFGLTFDGLEHEKVGIFYGYLEYISAIWHNL